MPTAEHESQASSEEAQRAALDAQAERDELLWLMSDKRGRRFMWRLLSRAAVHLTSFTGDALSSAFAEGRKLEGYHQTTLITKHCPSRYLEMQKEARTNERRPESTAS